MVNLIPHAINLVSGDVVIELPPSGLVAHIALRRVPAGSVSVDGLTVPVYKTEVAEPPALPPIQEGTYYVVSRLVASTCRERADLLVPDEVVRDGRGRVVGARALSLHS